MFSTILADFKPKGDCKRQAAQWMVVGMEGIFMKIS